MKMGLVARSCARVGRKDVVGEVKGIEMMVVLGAGRGARESVMINSFKAIPLLDSFSRE